MFPETDSISDIISDTIKVVFQRRLVGLVANQICCAGASTRGKVALKRSRIRRMPAKFVELPFGAIGSESRWVESKTPIRPRFVSSISAD
jgi:hypothetical protein